MKHFLTFLLMLSFSCTTHAQKIIEIPQNDRIKGFLTHLPGNLDKYHLSDLQKSTDSLCVRIWADNEVFTLSSKDPAQCSYKIHTNQVKPIVLERPYSGKISRILLDSMVSHNLLNLQDEPYRGIDGSFVYFEISTKASYKICSFWSPDTQGNENCKNAAHILDHMHKTLHTTDLYTEFFNTLEPGDYSWGMSGIHIDRFLQKEVHRTDFYLYAENRIRKELNITEKTSPLNFPIVLINHKPASIASLNQYSQKELVRFDILKPGAESTARYGSRAGNGVVIMETK
jgi:hypothetical protein